MARCLLMHVGAYLASLAGGMRLCGTLCEMAPEIALTLPLRAELLTLTAADKAFLPPGLLEPRIAAEEAAAAANDAFYVMIPIPSMELLLHTPCLCA